MQKGLVALVCLSVATIATSAAAASYSVSNVNATASGGSSATAGVNTVMNGSETTTEVHINGQLMQSDQAQPPMPLVGKQLPPTPGRESNRQIIDRIRNKKPNPPDMNDDQNVIRVVNKVQTVNGSTTGEVHIYRKENGQVIEDRTMPIPPNAMGKPFLFRSSSSVGTTSGKMLMGRMMATGSRTLMIRDIASSTGLPWLMHVPFFSVKGMGVSSSSGDNEKPFVKMLGRVFNMFKQSDS